MNDGKRPKIKDYSLIFWRFFCYISFYGKEETMMANKNHSSIRAHLGDNFLFSRKGMLVEGIVSIVNENSVIANISYEDSQALNYSTTTTVVGHKNYTILSSQVRRGIV
jgi:uncharacterized protein YkvS